jgi:hypothetical protein
MHEIDSEKSCANNRNLLAIAYSNNKEKIPDVPTSAKYYFPSFYLRLSTAFLEIWEYMDLYLFLRK